MRRLPGLVATIAILAATTPALAHHDLTSLTSQEPLQRVLDGFANGEESDGLFLSGEQSAGITSQFQFLVNLGAGPVFGYEDVEIVPSGLPGEGVELISLEEQFDGVFGSTDLLPPLDPWRAEGGTTDITSLTEGWTAYGELGRVEGSITVVEPATVVWGIELVEPFDETCPTTSWVGRAWEGESLGSPDPLFTTEELANWHPDSHDALAGQYSRLIEFGCHADSEPLVRVLRMTDDQGARPFGPLDVVALVNGKHIVFMHTFRILDSQVDQHFFATPTGGGPIALSSQIDLSLALLVPNPYDELPVRIELSLDLEQGGESSNADASANALQARTLLYRLDGPEVVPVGFQCRVRASFLFAPDLSDLTPLGEDFLFWLSVYSLWAEAILNNGIIAYDIVNPDGSVETVLIDLNDETWTGMVEQAPGSSDPDCETGGTVTMTGGSFVAVGDEPGTDGGEGDEGESGVRWTPIRIALGLLAVALAVAVTRRRTRAKDCEAERQAYAAAETAYDKARKTTEYWLEELRAAEETQGETARQLPAEFPPPHRTEYPEGSEGDAAYAAAMSQHEADEAARADTGAVDSDREAADAARAAYEEARTAQAAASDILEAARIALRECEKSEGGDGGSVAPPPTPASGETEQSLAPECRPSGTTKVEPEAGLPSATFVVPKGNIVMGSTMASWNRVMGGPSGIDPSDLEKLDDDDLDDALVDFDLPGSRKIRVHPRIHVKTIIVSCGRLWKCQGGKWVRTAETARLPDREEATSMEEFGHQSDSPSKQTIKNNVNAAKARLEVLLAAQREADDFSCD